MQFDNSINIGDIIGILALGITFKTLWMMKKQREDANRPYLVVDYNNKFDENFSIKPKNFYIEENWEDLNFYYELYSLDKNPFDFKVINIGNGVAREIKVKIKVENIDIIKQDDNMYIKDNLLILECPEEIRDRYIKGKYLDDYEFEFSNLGSNNSFSLTNNLKRFESIVNSVILHYMSNEDLESIRNSLIPSINLELEYKSILNKKFKEIYEINIFPGVYGSFECIYTVKLKNNKR